MLGGGILRIRPDGTEMEEFSHGLRNVYKVAIDPYMNIFTRDNTNDGGGWNIRFSHQHQTAEYGYPVLFQNLDRKSTRLNSSHVAISYAVFCLKKKKIKTSL